MEPPLPATLPSSSTQLRGCLKRIGGEQPALSDNVTKCMDVTVVSMHPTAISRQIPLPLTHALRKADPAYETSTPLPLCRRRRLQPHHQLRPGGAGAPVPPNAPQPVRLPAPSRPGAGRAGAAAAAGKAMLLQRSAFDVCVLPELLTTIAVSRRVQLLAVSRVQHPRLRCCKALGLNRCAQSH